MPTYTYRCNTCNEVTEINQSIHDLPLTHCLKCNGESNQLLHQTLAFNLKGLVFIARIVNKFSFHEFRVL